MNDYTIADSGERIMFETGAARDVEAGKGRFDLLPLEEISFVTGDSFYNYFAQYRKTNDNTCLLRAFLKAAIRLYNANVVAADELYMKDATAYMIMNALAVHYAKGAEKYSERNWEKGLPVSRYISSALRHYTQAVAGVDTNENHAVSALWNILGALFTARQHPELNDFVDHDYVREQLSLIQKEQSDEAD